MTSNLLVIHSKGLADILNRKSALGSYVKVLCDLLSPYYGIFVNGQPLHADCQPKQAPALLLTPRVPGLKASAATSSFAFKQTIKKHFNGGFLLLRDILTLIRSLQIAFKSLRSRRKYDNIIEFYSYLSVSGFLAAKLTKVPLIIIYDAPVDEEFTFFNNRPPVLLRLVNYLQYISLQRAAHIVVYSDRVAEFLVEKFKVDEDKIRVHQNVDFSRFDYFAQKQVKRDAAIKVGFIGSFLKWHRVDLLIQAFEHLKACGYNLHLYLIGDGMEMGKIRKLVSQSPYQDAITLTGFVDGGELKAYKQLLHIGVMPSSNWYGAPAKIFEYAAAGMAVIAPNTPTISYLFQDKKELLLIENNSQESLQQALQSCCANPDYMSAIAATLQHKVLSKYNEQETLNFYIGLLG